MGRVQKTVTTYTCDICQDHCEEYDGDITIKVSEGYGTDMGPNVLRAKLRYTASSPLVDSAICYTCKKKYLLEYMKGL